MERTESRGEKLGVRTMCNEEIVMRLADPLITTSERTKLSREFDRRLDEALAEVLALSGNAETVEENQGDGR